MDEMGIECKAIFHDEEEAMTVIHYKRYKDFKSLGRMRN